MIANLKLYVAIMGKHVPQSAYAALGSGAWNARALVVASHKGLAHRAAAQAGVKVNLNGWRVASPPTPHSANADVDLLLRTKILHTPKPGDVLLSRSFASGFVARWHHGTQRWTRVAEFVDDQVVLLPGAINEMRWSSSNHLWEIDAGAWRARIRYSYNHHGEWMGLDTVLHCHEFPRKTL